MNILNRKLSCGFYGLLVMFIMSLTTAHATDGERFVTLNDAITLEFNDEIGTIFISNPSIADYKVVTDNKLVLFANAIGQAKVIVYNKDHHVLLSQQVYVDLNLSQVRRQLKLHYPQLNIELTAVGEQVAVNGMVHTEKQRDDIYRMVATLLQREPVERFEETSEHTFETEGFEQASWATFSNNYTWEGIVEGLTLHKIQQVNVKISVAQVSQEFNETIGIDWSAGNSVGEFSFLEFKAKDITTVISAIGKDNIAQVLAEPNLTVMSGESASFLVGGEVPVVTTSDNNTNISFKEFGIKLELSAKVLENDKIQLQLAPEVSSVEKYIKAAGIEVPQLTSRRAMTTIQLKDGDSFMLGGLMNSEDMEQISKIPLLGDIPYFGAAFRKSTTIRNKSELIIVATVNLIKPIKPTEVRLPQIHKTTTLERLFHITPKHGAYKTDDPMVIEFINNGGFIQ